MKRPDKTTDSDLLFDLPLKIPAAHQDGAETAEVTRPGIEFAEAQTPLVFESPDPHETKETAAPAFTTGSPGEPPLGARFSAAILDLGTLVAGLAVAVGGASVLGIRPTLALWPPLVLFLLSFSFLYTVMPLAFWGKTPGMAYARIVCRGNDGLPLTIPQTVLRWAGLVIVYAGAGLPALLALSGVSLSDLLSRSRVLIDDRPRHQT
ncbi:MAG: RDD family protein [Acidobacteriota bacterium]|nr:RDD family protein [Acidobacteriota bacterium]